MRDVEVRKVASGLTALSNEKQREARDRASGKKKKAVKPALGSTKAIGKCVPGLGHFDPTQVLTAHIGYSRADTNMYDEALDDFGNDPNDFM